MQIAKKFDTKFTVHREITEIYEELLDYDLNSKQYVPGVYENNVSNLPEQACKYLIQDIGKCNSKTLCLYYDRRHLYGLKHFDMQKVNSSMESKSALTKKIIKRDNATVVIPSQTYRFKEIIDSVFELKRFPMLLVIDPKKAFEHLETTHNILKNYFNHNEISVLFRVDDKSNPFNKYIFII